MENNTITLKTILDSLENEETRTLLFSKFNNTQPTSDELKGLKLFLENNNYDYKLLQTYLKNSKPTFDTLLEEKKKKNPLQNWLKYAAVLIPLIGTGYFMLNNTSKNLYAKYYEKEVGLPVTMGNDNKIIFNEAMNAFKDNEFEESLLGFNELLKNNTTNDTLHYFIGCANLELNNLNKAILNFEEVKKPQHLKEKSDFKLVLVYLKEEEYRSAKKILQKISENKNHHYYTVALTMLEEPLFN